MQKHIRSCYGSIFSDSYHYTGPNEFSDLSMPSGGGSNLTTGQNRECGNCLSYLLSLLLVVLI